MDRDKKQVNPRDHLANERTFLAWIRTSISIIAFGLAVFKFTLFEGHSGMVGIILEVAGILTTVLSYIYYKRSQKQLNEGHYQHSSILLTILTVFISLVCLFFIVYFMIST